MKKISILLIGIFMVTFFALNVSTNMGTDPWIRNETYDNLSVGDVVPTWHVIAGSVNPKINNTHLTAANQTAEWCGTGAGTDLRIPTNITQFGDASDQYLNWSLHFSRRQTHAGNVGGTEGIFFMKLNSTNCVQFAITGGKYQTCAGFTAGCTDTGVSYSTDAWNSERIEHTDLNTWYWYVNNTLIATINGAQTGTAGCPEAIGLIRVYDVTPSQCTYISDMITYNATVPTANPTTQGPINITAKYNHSLQAYELVTTSFGAVLNITSANLTGINASLYYNNSLYFPNIANVFFSNISKYDITYNWTNQIQTPFNIINSTNYTFTYIFNITYINGTVLQQNYSFNQTVAFKYFAVNLSNPTANGGNITNISFSIFNGTVIASQQFNLSQHITDTNNPDGQKISNGGGYGLNITTGGSSTLYITSVNISDAVCTANPCSLNFTIVNSTGEASFSQNYTWTWNSSATEDGLLLNLSSAFKLNPSSIYYLVVTASGIKSTPGTAWPIADGNIKLNGSVNYNPSTKIVSPRFNSFEGGTNLFQINDIFYEAESNGPLPVSENEAVLHGYVQVNGTNYTFRNMGNVTQYVNVSLPYANALLANNPYIVYLYANYSSNFSIRTNNGTFTIRNSIINVTAREFFTNTSIQSFTVQFESSDGIDRINATTSSFQVLQGLGNKTYNVTIFPAGGYSRASTLQNIQGSTSFNNLTFYLFANNSIYVTIYDEGNGNLVTHANVTVSFVMNTSTQSITTQNGTAFYSGLSPGNIIVRLSSTPYATRSYLVNLPNNYNLSLNAYMIAASAQATTFTVSNQQFQVLNGVRVTAQRSVSNQIQTVESKETDISGDAIFTLNTSAMYHFIFVKGNITVEFDLQPTKTGYDIYLVKALGDTFKALFGTIVSDIDPSPGPFQANSGGFTNFNFTVVSLDNTPIEFFGARAYYNSTVWLTNSTASGGGIAILPVNISNATGQTIFVEYFVKVPGYQVQIFNYSYYIESFANVSQDTFVGATQALGDESIFTTTLLSMAIIVVVIIVLVSVGVPPAAAAMTGLILEGALSYYKLLPWAFTITSLVVGIGLFYLTRNRQQ